MHVYVFYRYDFDNDGLVQQSDVHLLLTHVPVMNSNLNDIKEGSYTSDGGSR